MSEPQSNEHLLISYYCPGLWQVLEIYNSIRQGHFKPMTIGKMLRTVFNSPVSELSDALLRDLEIES